MRNTPLFRQISKFPESRDLGILLNFILNSTFLFFGFVNFFVELFDLRFRLRDSDPDRSGSCLFNHEILIYLKYFGEYDFVYFLFIWLKTVIFCVSRNTGMHLHDFASKKSLIWLKILSSPPLASILRRSPRGLKRGAEVQILHPVWKLGKIGLKNRAKS